MLWKISNFTQEHCLAFFSFFFHGKCNYLQTLLNSVQGFPISQIRLWEKIAWSDTIHFVKVLLNFEYLKRFFFRLNTKYLGVLKISVSKKERTDVANALDWNIKSDCMLRKKRNSIKYVLHVKVWNIMLKIFYVFFFQIFL